MMKIIRADREENRSTGRQVPQKFHSKTLRILLLMANLFLHVKGQELNLWCLVPIRASSPFSLYHEVQFSVF